MLFLFLSSILSPCVHFRRLFVFKCKFQTLMPKSKLTYLKSMYTSSFSWRILNYSGWQCTSPSWPCSTGILKLISFQINDTESLDLNIIKLFLQPGSPDFPLCWLKSVVIIWRYTPPNIWKNLIRGQCPDEPS